MEIRIFFSKKIWGCENLQVKLWRLEFFSEKNAFCYVSCIKISVITRGSAESVLLFILLHIIYNSILSSHIFPTAWRTTTVTEIFKNKGDTKHASNYRPVTLVQLMAKLFDLILVSRFQKWFTPADEQTAYQANRGSADHVFLLRCLIQKAKHLKEKVFIIAIDFDRAFDRVSRSLLIRKLILFGAGIVFVSCIASIYMRTDSIMFRNKEYMSYTLLSGIKQGLPLSPLLFIFYVNDIFDFFGSLFDNPVNIIYEKVHILMHADDATIIAANRERAQSKLNGLLTYCNLNYIIPQYKKCEFIVINGIDNDKVSLAFGNKNLKHTEHMTILGSHLYSNGHLKDDLELHMKKRFPSVIKFYNFLRANRHAPLPVNPTRVGRFSRYQGRGEGGIMPPPLGKIPKNGGWG